MNARRRNVLRASVRHRRAGDARADHRRESLLRPYLPTMSDRDERSATGSPLPPNPEKASLLDDFMDIFYAPSRVFARRANSGFWIPLLIVTVLLGVIFVANRDLIDPIMEAEMART